MLVICFPYLSGHWLNSPDDSISRNGDPEGTSENHTSERTQDIERNLPEEVFHRRKLVTSEPDLAVKHLTTHARIDALACKHFMLNLYLAALAKFVQRVKDLAINLADFAMAIGITHRTSRRKQSQFKQRDLRLPQQSCVDIGEPRRCPKCD
jgi:hypothetical protein